jgi:hypothetical protein
MYTKEAYEIKGNNQVIIEETTKQEKEKGVVITTTTNKHDSNKRIESLYKTFETIGLGWRRTHELRGLLMRQEGNEKRLDRVNRTIEKHSTKEKVKYYIKNIK